jgi:hypothetical protein
MGGAVPRPVLVDAGLLKVGLRTSVDCAVRNTFMALWNYSYNSPGNTVS